MQIQNKTNIKRLKPTKIKKLHFLLALSFDYCSPIYAEIISL